MTPPYSFLNHQYSSVWNLEFQYKRLALRLRFNYGLDSSYQIYTLHEETKMNSLELLAGFRL